jgi:hypothetical protein
MKPRRLHSETIFSILAVWEIGGGVSVMGKTPSKNHKRQTFNRNDGFHAINPRQYRLSQPCYPRSAAIGGVSLVPTGSVGRKRHQAARNVPIKQWQNAESADGAAAAG